MRALPISAVFVIVACSGNSVDVGSDSGGNSGSAGTRAGSAGSPAGDDDVPTGGDAGTTGRGGRGAGGTISGGGPAGGVAGVSAGGSQGASGGTTGVGGSSAGMGGTTIITSCTDEFPFAGEWRGSILDFYFEPMESLLLTVSEQSGGAGGFVGEPTFGSGDPPAPATDPDEPYPPGLDTGSAGAAGGSSRGGSTPLPGFPYTVVRGAGCDATFRVSISTAQVWESWCALQTPVYTESSDMWGCTFRGGGASDGTTCQIQDNQGNPFAEYPLWKCNLCGWAGGGVCTCDAERCVASPEPTHVYNLMLTRSGGVDVLSGSDASCPDCTVRLERAD